MNKVIILLVLVCSLLVCEANRKKGGE